MRKLILSAAAMVAVMTAAGCGNDLMGVSEEVVGTYQLQSVNGSLPYIATTPAPPTTYTGGELELDGNGNFDRTYRTAAGETHVVGTWERIGSAIRLHVTEGNRVIWAEFREDDGAIIVHDENEADWRYER